VNTLCVVPCGKSKIWDKHPNAGPTQAKDVYTGPFASSCRQYAQAFYPGAWVILSAKHGFLLPDDRVRGPYEVSFNDPNTHPISSAELGRQAKAKGLDKYDQIVAIAGANYAKRIREALPGKPVRTPLAGASGMGTMMAKLKAAVGARRPL